MRYRHYIAALAAIAIGAVVYLIWEERPPVEQIAMVETRPPERAEETAVQPPLAGSSEAMPIFTEWTRRYLAAVPGARAALLEEGVRLARERRPVFKQLIMDDPRAAIEQAVPMVVRQQLPPIVLAQLERRIIDIGALRVFQGVPLNPDDPPVPTTREVELKSGGTYRAYVYGKREEKLTWTAGAFVNGVAVDSEFAISDEPTRRLEVGENMPPGKPVVSECPVSGKVVLDPADVPSVVPESLPAVETPIEIITFCDGSHIAIQNETILYGEGVTGGSFAFSGILPGSPTPALGQVKVIVIPTTYADQNAIPATEAELYATLRDVADHYAKASYGRLSLVGVVTPPVKLPHNEAWYVNRDTSNGGDIGGTGISMADARAEARKLGFDWNDYDCTVMRHNGGPGSYGGLGGGSTVWVRGNGVGLWAHEIGHAFGLGHSNFWDTAGTSSIGNGANAEYGDSYDIMGSSGSFPAGHYNAQAKSQIRWLPSSFVQPVAQSGIYRLHAFDQGSLDSSRRYALTIVKDVQRTYWGMVRSLFDSNPFAKNGLVFGWRFPSGGGGNFQLIDTTNGSPYAKTDAPISLGATFSDTESGIHVTTIAVNDNPRYIDVQVNLGSFPGNQPPTMSLAASAEVIPLNGTVTFTATASDPDSDPLAFNWQHFGSGTQIVSPNSNVITRQFTAAGTYIVTCTASDMKGGTVTRNKLITVGSATTFTISGRVTLLGQGLQDVVVTANNANGVITDADGYFTIANLSANTYTLTPLLYGYTFSELFNNSITVGPNFSGADFEATAQSVVTISAPNPNANEGPVTAATFRLTRTGDTSQDLVVNVNAASGGATKTTDYTFSPDYVSGSQGFSTFTIPADSDTLEITVTPVVDATSEGPETVILQLGPGNGYLVGSASSATVVIADDDTALPKVSLVATTPATTEGSASPAVFTVARTGSTAAGLTVNYAVTGTATSGSDFTALSGSVTIPSGASSATVEVATVNDTISELLETAILTLSTNAAYVIDPLATTGTASLYDDDLQTVNVVATDTSAAEADLSVPDAAADTGTFLITRSGDTSQPLTVYYAFSGTNGSGVMALHGVDFEWMPGVVVIPAGQTSAAVTIVPRFDGVGEGVEQCVLTLGASATNYILGTSNSATVNIADHASDTPYINVVNTASASEPSTNGNFRFGVRGAPSASTITVHYTLSGTAANDTDYTGGTGWAAQASGTTNALRAVWGTSATSVWAVGDDGTILKWDGSTWSAQASGTTNALRAVWGTSATSVWAVGDDGTILKFNGTAWSAQASGTTNALRAVWGTSATSVWAVGDDGTILKFNGTAWSAQTSNVSTALNSVWGNSATSLWAVGAGGIILRSTNGTTWTAQTSGTTTVLASVWGTSSTSLWAAGAGGVILRSTNGTTWTAQTTNIGVDFTTIRGTDGNNLWASGAAGTVLRTSNSGNTWAALTTNQVLPLHGVWPASTSNIWAVGDAGTSVNLNTAVNLPLTGTLVIPAGASTVDLAVRPIDDADLEELETITLTITPAASYQTYAPTTSATAWLRDNDNVNTLVVDTQVGTSGATSITEGASTSPVKFYVSRLGSTTSALTVNCSYSGTATGGGVDYSAPASVTIPAGATGVDVPVTIVNDTAFEGTETILFDFAPGAYARGVGAVMYITDNDTATATVAFDAPSSSGGESTTTVNVPVTLSAAQGTPVTVEYAVSGTTTASNSSLTTNAIPYWVRVVKTGNSIAFFQSNDGQMWTQRGNSVTVSGLGSNYLAGIAFAPGSTTQYTATIDNFSVTGLSGGSAGAETTASIGTVTGGSSSAAGVYTFTNSGNGILNGTSDNFRYVYVPVTGSANCTVTARVTSVGNGISSSSRAGVMLRTTTAANAIHASSLGTGLSTGSFYTLYRATAGSATTVSSAFNTLLLPMWVRTVRAGNVFTQSLSRDGATWTNFGTSPSIAFAPKVFAGLAVSAASDGQIATATFDNVTLDGNPITALGGRTIGFVNAQGSESYGAGVWTVDGSGAGISGGNDEAHFPSMEVTGDFTLVARVTSLTGGANGAQAGVMVRDDRTHYARAVHTGWVKSGSVEQRYRLQSNTTAFGSGVDFVLPPGVLTFDPGETTKNITFTVVNDTINEPDNLVTIQLSNPLGAGLGTNSYHGYTILDDDDPPAQPFVGFATDTSSVVENAGAVLIAVALSAPAATACSVDYFTTDGGATQPGDYTTASGTLSFEAGESVKVITVPITDDAAVETPESFTVTLQSPSGLNLGSASTHTITITDDDFPTVNIVVTDASAAESGDTGTFTITRAGSTAGDLTVNFTRSGTATSGSDYTAIATPGSVVIPDGQANATVTVTPSQDTNNEGNETVILTLTANASYTLGTPASTTVTIDDDDRSTVTIAANDPDASETAGNPGQFTITRTAPTTAVLSVALTISGTATNGTDYTTITTPVSIPIGATTAVVNVTPVDDGNTEGPEDVTISLNTGSYDIGAASFDNVTIADNDNPPTVFINSPTTQGPLVAAANGVIVSATVSDDGFPAPLTTTWSCVSGPGTASIESPNASTTAVTFSAPGTYVLRITASDTQFTASDQITIVVGSGLVASNWITQDLGPSSARRGQGLEYGGLFSVTGTGVGYASTSNDQAHIMVRSAIGDGSVVARLTSLNVSTALAGVTIRDSLARGSRRAVLGYVPGTGLQFRTRAGTGNDTSVAAGAPALPCWLKLERNAATNEISASYAPDVGGAPGAWTAVGSPVAIPLLNTNAHYGLTTTNNSTAGTATAIFDNVTLTPAPSGPALVNEDSGTAPNTPGSASFDGTTYTLAGPTTGYFYGWQFCGDMVITARLNTFSSGAGSSSGGIRVAESIEGGAQLHLGRMPTGSYSGYYWTSIAGAGGGGVPSGIAAGNWMRIVRRGNSITGYRATHNSGTNGPNAWIQIGQPQTVIMTTPVWVGFFVNNASGATGTLNTCTFTRLTIEPLNIGPDIDLTALPSTTIGDATLDATVTDDGSPAPTSLTTTWTGSAGVTFGNASAVDTSASFPQFGDHTLRLRADDTGIVTFRDAAITYFESAFQQWQAQNFSGNPNHPDAAPTADPEHDGIPNLFEYFSGLLPGVFDVKPWTLDQATVGADKFLRLTITRNPAAMGVTCEVEATGDITSTLSWTSAGLVIEEDTPTTLRVRDSVPIGSGGPRFMRAKVGQ